jgi:hypothetical protein
MMDDLDLQVREIVLKWKLLNSERLQYKRKCEKLQEQLGAVECTLAIERAEWAAFKTQLAYERKGLLDGEQAPEYVVTPTSTATGNGGAQPDTVAADGHYM